MPNAGTIFMLGEVIASDGTGLGTTGADFYAPFACDIITINHCNCVNTTTDVLSIFVSPISAAAGPQTAGAAVVVVASSMFAFASADYGSFKSDTLRQLNAPTDSSSVGRHLNKNDGINVAWTSGGTVANVKGICIQVWAQVKR